MTVLVKYMAKLDCAHVVAGSIQVGDGIPIPQVGDFRTCVQGECQGNSSVIIDVVDTLPLKDSKGRIW